MKHLRGILLSLLVFVSALFAEVQPVWAASPYTYTVTFLAGNQGRFGNISRVNLNVPGTASVSAAQDKIVISGLSYNDVINFNAPSAVNLDNSSKYYVKGFRLSGRDNNTVAYSSFKVIGDQDYVIAYGIPGDLTQYTVRYQDEAGNDLAESQTYYGNVGDEPVLAFLYIDGYVPTNMNLSRPLSANAEENVFTFVYTSGSIEEILGAVNNAEDTNGAGAANGADDANGAQAGINENTDETTVIDDDATPTANNPNPLSTISDALTPLASNISDFAKAGVLTPFLVGIPALVILIVLWIFIMRKKKKNIVETDEKTL